MYCPGPSSKVSATHLTSVQSGDLSVGDAAAGTAVLRRSPEVISSPPAVPTEALCIREVTFTRRNVCDVNR
ncbi:hypothetical protein GCM10007079_21510 [Nocardiopsis terrae]|nr:hypothetical protein GCM10007079_21510 [Nocardiopsis terrae]